MRCSVEPSFKVQLLKNTTTPIFFRDQHADDVKEDFEERTESEMRTSHEARGSHYHLVLGMDITMSTQQSKFSGIQQSLLY